MVKDIITDPSTWTIEFILSKSFQDFIDLIPEAAIISNPAGQIVKINSMAQKIFGYSKKEFLQLLIEDLVPKEIHDHHVSLRGAFFKNPRSRFLEGRHYELSAVRKDKSEFPIDSALFAIETDNGLVAVNLLRDLSKEKELQSEVNDLAYLDALTSIPNRRYFDDIFGQKISAANRYKKKLGLLFIDLDYFKLVNDEHGHAIGDKVLQIMSKRLQKELRKEDFLARIGGDEFIVLLYPTPSKKGIKEIVTRVLEICQNPIKVDGHCFNLSASIGIAISNNTKIDGKKLFYAADQAMYKAKLSGRDQFNITEL
jgi:diguanylate cyclase (GGDEF)-like protein/PAS domain S-box-containing protein